MSPARTAQTAATGAAVGSTWATDAQCRARSAAGADDAYPVVGTLLEHLGDASMDLGGPHVGEALAHGMLDQRVREGQPPGSGLLHQARQESVVGGVDEP